MTPETDVAALSARYRLGAAQERALLTLLARLTDDPHAPTAITDPTRAVADHLADSLAGLELTAVRDAAAIVDIGSGAGLPGLPLAIALPTAQVTLLEANARKCEFIVAACTACGAENTEVVAGRAEEWSDGIGRHDIVTARALARLDVVAEYAAPLLRIGGALGAWRGQRDPVDEAAGAAAAARLGLEQADPIAVTPYWGARYRHLHVLTKVGETPAAFPRRPGMARKRPLGGPIATGRPDIRERR